MAGGSPIDAVALARDLIRLPTVTPDTGAALDHLAEVLTSLGFACQRADFDEPGMPEVGNLYARIGDGAPNLCFAGHTDVVPPGHAEAWDDDPFQAVVKDGVLYGRGAADMKSAIAAFVAAAARHLADDPAPAKGSLSLLITADEEGPAINGTRKMLQWLAERGEKLDFCLVGEPTNPASLGEMIKIGRRGSLTGYLTVKGIGGHVAYPHRAENPIPGLFEILGALTGAPLDDGTEEFEPSNIEVTTVDVGNPAVNVIPAAAHATFNIRFNDLHTPESLEREIRARCDAASVAYELEILVSGEAFVSDHHAMLDALVDAIRDRTGSDPILSTTGGTSDARFIKDYCPVAEFGMVGATMHKVNEHVGIDDIAALEDIYLGVIRRMLA